MGYIHAQVQAVRATAAALACSLFRRDHAHLDRQRSREDSIPGAAHPGSCFAHIVEARYSWLEHLRELTLCLCICHPSIHHLNKIWLR